MRKPCKALEDLYNDGTKKGRELGLEMVKKREIESGIIQGTVETLKEFDVPMEAAIERIMKKFHVTKEKAQQEMEKYWN